MLLSVTKITINTFHIVYQTSVYENNAPGNYVQLFLLLGINWNSI